MYAAWRREIYFSRFQIIRWWIDRLYRRVDRRVSSKPHTNRSIVLSGRSTDDAKCCINYSETMRDWSRYGNLSDASLLLSLNVPSPRSMAGSQTSSFFYRVFWRWEKRSIRAVVTKILRGIHCFYVKSLWQHLERISNLFREIFVDNLRWKLNDQRCSYKVSLVSGIANANGLDDNKFLIFASIPMIILLHFEKRI